MCPACSRTNVERLPFRRDDYALLRCAECGLRFSDPMKGEADYSPIFERRMALVLADPAGALKRAGQRWNINLALKKLGTPRRVLDAGSGSGQFLALAQRSGHQVTGIELNPDSVQVSRDAYGLQDVFCGSLKEFARTDGRRFDAVVSLEVMEHTEDPVGFLRQVAERVAPGGMLHLSVPGWDRWPPYYDPETDYPPHHLTLWTRTALEKAVERAGLQCRSIVRCPLRHDDILRHINLYLQRWFFPRKKTAAEPGVREGTEVQPNMLWKAYTRLASTTARELVRHGFHLPALLLRLHPRSGGFDYFVSAFKPAADAASGQA